MAGPSAALIGQPRPRCAGESKWLNQTVAAGHSECWDGGVGGGEEGGGLWTAVLLLVACMAKKKNKTATAETGISQQPTETAGGQRDAGCRQSICAGPRRCRTVRYGLNAIDELGKKARLWEKKSNFKALKRLCGQAGEAVRSRATSGLNFDVKRKCRQTGKAYITYDLLLLLLMNWWDWSIAQ